MAMLKEIKNLIAFPTIISVGIDPDARAVSLTCPCNI